MSLRLRQAVSVCAGLVGEVERAGPRLANGPGDVDAAMAEFGFAAEGLLVDASTCLEICDSLGPDAGDEHHHIACVTA